MENLGNLWPFTVDFMDQSLSVIDWQHFEESVPKVGFQRLWKRSIFQLFGCFCSKVLKFADLLWQKLTNYDDMQFLTSFTLFFGHLGIFKVVKECLIFCKLWMGNSWLFAKDSLKRKLTLVLCGEQQERGQHSPLYFPLEEPLKSHPYAYYHRSNTS